MVCGNPCRASYILNTEYGILNPVFLACRVALLFAVTDEGREEEKTHFLLILSVRLQPRQRSLLHPLLWR